MACRVRYLNSAGIHPREIPGINALAAAFPSQWLLYASLQCYPSQGSPIEIDAMVVMDDRVLILEIKDWNGTLTSNGDQWVMNGRPRGRSPVDTVSMKARRIKSLLSSSIPGFSQHYVDSRVVLTATANKAALAPEEQSQVWTLDEACSIGTLKGKAALLRSTPAHLKKTYNFEPELERVTRNARIWGAMEAIWDGYRVVEENFVVHPREIWREHRAERVRDPRFRALLRIWSFDRLPPGLNSTEHRRFIADRESQAIGYLSNVGSWLVQQGGILQPTGEDKEEILTQHFELRALLPGWTTLDRYLERAREDLTVEDRIVLTTTLINTVAELHRNGIAHRDLGLRSIWMGSPTKAALSGLMSCQMPGERSLGDWYSVLRGYSSDAPEDNAGATKGTGKERDVFSLGRLAYEVLTGTTAPTDAGDGTAANNLPEQLVTIAPWLRRATATVPAARFPDAATMADEFTQFLDTATLDPVDQTVLDRSETADIPYVLWPIHRTLQQDSRCHVYVARDAHENELVVKVWLNLRRGLNSATDLAMTRLFEGVRRLAMAPLSGFSVYQRAGLSPTGPFVVYRHEEGLKLDAIGSFDLEKSLASAERLIHCIDALHAMDFSHGDIADKNILVRPDGGLQLLDLFDMTSVGDGHVRTPSLCPQNWEKLTEQQIDRYATLSVASRILSMAQDVRLESAIEALRRELERPAIETFEPAVLILKEISAQIRGPLPPRFDLKIPSASPEYFLPDDGTYYLRVARSGPDRVRYNLTGIEREMTLDAIANQLAHVQFQPATYSSLMHASQRGLPIRIQINVDDGEQAGFEDLLAFIAPLISPVAIDNEQATPGSSGYTLDVPRYWRKLIDLEEAFQPEIEILKDLGSRGGVAAYMYERLGGDFDFDEDSVIDVRLPNNRKVGEADLNQTDARTLVVRYSDRPLVIGDRVKLIDRRAKASFDRRRKGVERILENDAAIENLIDYFSPSQSLSAIDLNVEVQDTDIEKYKLNKGQSEAFRHLMRFGPIGLLQGPPGTGKTRFIAAFVHWLVTRAGAQKILIASQSHESVNNAIEALVDLFKRFGGRPRLLRIGSKGITDKIRPYHTSSLRERYQVRFEAAFKHRVATLGTAVGLRRQFVIDSVEIDRHLGNLARYVRVLTMAAQNTGPTSTGDQRRNETAMRNAIASFAQAARDVLGREVDLTQIETELDAAFDGLMATHPGTSEADVKRVRQLIELSHEWSASLASSHRNFEEFLAKTRTIVTATCVGVGQTKIRMDAKAYDWVIVDEAARCTPGELAVPIQVGRRVLLVGDHLQLKPMIERQILHRLEEELPEASQAELTRSDFERAYTSSFGQGNGQILTEQYRMAPAICDMVSKVFYEPQQVRLTTSLDREPDTIIEGPLPSVLSMPITWIDTSFDQGHTDKPAEWNKHTFWNHAEVEAVIKILERIAETDGLVAALSASRHETPIGVICMYSAQKVKIEQAFSQRPWDARFRRLVRIDTVDSYQGKENTIVIVSLVRCNDQRDAGHVSSPNRCNVALSRARECLFIVGASRMWAGAPERQPIRRVVDHIKENPKSARVLKTGEL